MLFFALLSLIKLSTISIDYTSFLVKYLVEDGENKIKTAKNILGIENETFCIPNVVNDETIVSPLSMLDNVMNYKSSILVNNDKMYITPFETPLTAHDINGLFLGMFGSYPNVVLSVRDYYDDKKNEQLFKSLNIPENTNVTILPASLAAVCDLILLDQEIQKFCIISTVGIMTVCNVYEVKKTNNAFSINSLKSITCEQFSDSILDKIIEEHVRKTLTERKYENVVLIPLLDDYKIKKDDLFLDISEICLDIKKNLISDVVKYTGVEPTAFDKLDLKRKKPIENLEWNFEIIKKEFLEVLEKKEVKKFVEDVNDACKDNEITRKYLISSFDKSIFKNIFLDNDTFNVPDVFILKGGIKFHLSKFKVLGNQIVCDDKRIISNKKMMLNSADIAKEEIQIKKRCIDNINKILETEGKYFKYLADDVLNSFKGFISKDVKLENLKLLEAQKFVGFFNKFTVQNEIVAKDHLTRPVKLKKLEDVLNEVSKHKNEEFWNNTLNKKYQEFYDFLEKFKDDKQITGDEFETKAYILEGIMNSSKLSFERKKKAEEEAAKKQAEEEAAKIKQDDKVDENVQDDKVDENVQEDKANENVQEDKANENVQEDKVNENVQEDKVNENVQEDKVDKNKEEDNSNENKDENRSNVDYESLEKNFSELFKNSKFKDMFDKYSNNFNPNTENRDVLDGNVRDL